MYISHVYRVWEYSGWLYIWRIRNITSGFDLPLPLTRFIILLSWEKDKFKNYTYRININKFRKIQTLKIYMKKKWYWFQSHLSATAWPTFDWIKAYECENENIKNSAIALLFIHVHTCIHAPICVMLTLYSYAGGLIPILTQLNENIPAILSWLLQVYH